MALAQKIIQAISPIDRLGAIQAQIAELELAEKVLKEEIKGFGLGQHDGELFRATVSLTADSYGLDIAAAAAKLRELGVDGRWFSKNQKLLRKGSTRINVVARS